MYFFKGRFNILAIHCFYMNIVTSIINQNVTHFLLLVKNDATYTQPIYLFIKTALVYFSGPKIYSAKFW